MSDEENVIDFGAWKVKKTKKELLDSLGIIYKTRKTLVDGKLVDVPYWVPTAGAIELILSSDPDLGSIAYDEFSWETVVRAPVPWTNSESKEVFPRRWQDSDAYGLVVYFEQEYGGIIKSARQLDGMVHTFCVRKRRFHAVFEYFGNRQWDGTPRVDRLLLDYYGTADTPYNREAGRVFMLSCAARLLVPGEKCDNVLTLEGGQGVFKSTSGRILALKSEWFGDCSSEVGTVKFAEGLPGKLIVEMGELSPTRKADIETLKAEITRQVDDYRWAYGMNRIAKPRTCVFYATTNDSSYLKDHTGGRRFLPVRVGTPNHEALARDAVQLWLEAIQRKRGGEPHWTTDKALLEAAMEEQEARYDHDVWEDTVVDYCHGRHEVTIREVLTNLGFDCMAKMHKAEEKRVAHILQRQGWRKGRVRTPGGRQWVWLPPEKMAATCPLQAGLVLSTKEEIGPPKNANDTNNIPTIGPIGTINNDIYIKKNHVIGFGEVLSDGPDGTSVENPNDSAKAVKAGPIRQSQSQNPGGPSDLEALLFAPRVSTSLPAEVSESDQRILDRIDAEEEGLF